MKNLPKWGKLRRLITGDVREIAKTVLERRVQPK